MKKVLFALLVIPVLLIGIIGCNKKDETTNSGNLASTSPVELLTLDGYNKLMEQYKGKVVLVNFFGSWCPPCKMETPDFVEVYNKYKDKNFVIIGIGVDTNVEDIKKFKSDYNISYPVYRGDKSLLAYFQINPIPASFAFNKDGSFIGNFTGYLSKDIVIKIAELGEK